MKANLSAALMLLVLSSFVDEGVDAWGGLFNRFSPEMLSNMGYGAHGGYPGKSSTYLQRPMSGSYANSFGDSLDEAMLEKEACYGKRCTANEHCCPGSVCVDDNSVTGYCRFSYGNKHGEICRSDNDCEDGLACADNIEEDTRTCQYPIYSNKQYSEECNMSSECDVTRGLCCQLQRRHRQASRKVCSYFKDPLVCIGPVATNQIKSVIQYTSGEKRITSQGNRLYKRTPYV